MSTKLPGETVVLVTGASGFLGSHVVRLLLREGYRVRGTVRSLKNAQKVDPIRQLNVDNRLELVEADLLVERGWKEVVEGCDYVQHVASPFPLKADESVIKTAIDGTMNVLKAVAASTTVKKVVLTSSVAAIMEGNDYSKTFTDKDWTNLDNKRVDFYPRSKILAEQAAWDFVKNNGGHKFALTTVNPSFIVGPPLIDEQGSSVMIIRRFLNNDMPGVPSMTIPCVDVRDVARCQVEAMRRSISDNERIIATAMPSLWMKDISKILNNEFKSQGYTIPSMGLPDFAVWMVSFFDADANLIVDKLSKEIKFDNSKAKKLLNIEFADPSDAIIEMAYAMIERGMAKKTKKYAGVPARYANG